MQKHELTMFMATVTALWPRMETNDEQVAAWWEVVRPFSLSDAQACLRRHKTTAATYPSQAVIRKALWRDFGSTVDKAPAAADPEDLNEFRREVEDARRRLADTTEERRADAWRMLLRCTGMVERREYETHHPEAWRQMPDAMQCQLAYYVSVTQQLQPTKPVRLGKDSLAAALRDGAQK